MKKQLCLSGAVVALVWAPNALPDTLVITEHQITDTAFYETTPTLGSNGTGDYVNYTSREMLNNGFFEQGDIWLRRLNPDGSPAGVPIAITSDLTDDKLNDGYGDYIVYTAYDSTMTSNGAIMLYQISTGLLQFITDPIVIQEPRIHGDTIVWVQGSVGASQVMRYELAWLGTATPPESVTGLVPTVFNVDIGDRFIVWVESSGDYDIGAYDMENNIRIKLTDTNLIDERHPSTSGDWIVWESRDAGATSKRIEAVNLETGDYRILSDTGAVASRPSIDGDLIAWESDDNGNYDVFVYRISTDETFIVTMDPTDQYLNDIFGDKISYVEYSQVAASQYDENVYVAHLTFVPDNLAPVADAGENQSIRLGEVAVLDGSGSSDPDGDPITFLWSIDSAPSGSTVMLSAPTSASPQLQPDLLGNYVLSLVVTDDKGSESLADTVTVYAVENQPPTAVVDADPTSGFVPLSVQFTGLGSSDPEGQPLSFTWDFGDSSPASSEPGPVHEYQAAGTYFAELTVTDDLGATDSDTIEIVVTALNNPPDINPSATPNNGAAPLAVQFTAGAIDPDGDPLSYEWHFGDGTPGSIESDPVHVYEYAGPYTAWVSVSDGQETVSGSVTVIVDSAIAITTRRAVVQWRGPRSAMGNIKLWATVDIPALNEDDLISVRLGDTELLVRTFGAFRQLPWREDVYIYMSRGVFARLDLASGRLFVVRLRVNLSEFEPGCVPVELNVDTDAAVETICLEERRGRRLVYNN